MQYPSEAAKELAAQLNGVEYAYSRNDKEGPWHEDIQDAVLNLSDDPTFEAEPGEEITIYRGEKTSFEHGDFASFIGETIQEHFQEVAYNEGGEHAETYLGDMTPDHRNELAKMVVDYLNQHCAQPSFWTVGTIEPFAIVWEPEDAK